jgi:hypothetical protein
MGKELDLVLEGLGQAASNGEDFRMPVCKPSMALPDGAGPADWWLAVLIDPTASQTRRDEAARELRRLGARAIREAQDRRSAMEEDRWWGSLSEAEQRELLRKGQGPRG